LQSGFRGLVWVDKRTLEAGAVLMINSVEPHPHAGLTGGRKSVLPGIVGFETIQANHALSFTPEAVPLSLEDNREHLDMTETAALFSSTIGSNNVRALNVVSVGGGLYAASYGEPEAVFEQLIPAVYETATVPFNEQAEVVIAVVQPPFNASLEQTMKALPPATLALKPGGRVILVTACQEVGSSTFASRFRRPQAEIMARHDYLVEHLRDFLLGEHFLPRAGRLWGSGSEIMIVNQHDQGLSSDVLAEFNLRAFATVEEAAAVALEELGPVAKINILFDAATTVPVKQD